MAESMQSFKWSGVDKAGKRTSGTLRSADVMTAKTELKNNGIEIVSITEARASLTSPRQKKVKQKDILLFTRFLSTLMSAGLPILQALEVIAKDQENAAMRGLLMQVKSNVAGGQTLTESFRKHPKYFSNLYCSLINTGEKSGTLDKILQRLAAYMEKTDTIKKKIKKALIYPAAIIVVSIVVSAILLIFVVPQFQSIFSSFGAQLPYFTRVVINLSQMLRYYWWMVILVVGGLVLILRQSIKNNERFAEWVDAMKLRITIVGPLMKKGIIARFTRTLAIALESGMPINDALKSMIDIMDNKVFSKAVMQIRNDVVNGHPLNVAMSASKLFPVMTVQMIAVGEVSGALGEMLNKVADYYEEDVGHMVDNLSNLLEPLIMVLLGVIIGGFVIAMYLPIFKIGSIVK